MTGKENRGHGGRYKKLKTTARYSNETALAHFLKPLLQKKNCPPNEWTQWNGANEARHKYIFLKRKHVSAFYDHLNGLKGSRSVAMFLRAIYARMQHSTARARNLSLSLTLKIRFYKSPTESSFLFPKSEKRNQIFSCFTTLTMLLISLLIGSLFLLFEKKRALDSPRSFSLSEHNAAQKLLTLQTKHEANSNRTNDTDRILRADG